MLRRARSALATLVRWFAHATWPGAIVPAVLWPRLQICEACKADYACPMEWEPEDSHSWSIRLRCGECGHDRVAVVLNEDAAAFEAQLARHTAAIQRSLDHLDRERMAGEVERLIAALDRDLLDAGDFA